MATVARTIDATCHASNIGGRWSWGSWATPVTGMSKGLASGSGIPLDGQAWRIQGAIQGTLTALSMSLRIDDDGTLDPSRKTVTAYLLTSDPRGESLADIKNGIVPSVGAATYNFTPPVDGQHTFTFSNLSEDSSATLYVVLLVTTGEVSGVHEDGTATSSVTVPALSVSITPSTVVLGNSVELSFSNRLGETLTLVFKSGSTTLGTYISRSDIYEITPPLEWYTTAGQTGTNLSVSVTASDQYGRTASGSFTIKKPQTYLRPLNSPTGGVINAGIAQTFGVTLHAEGTYFGPDITQAVFHWRSNSTDPWTDVNMTPDRATARVTIPANTFPAGSLYWYGSASDAYGNDTETEIFTVSTLASEIDAQPSLPSGTIETKNTPTVFTWQYATTTGYEQAAAELQYSTDGSVWSALGSVTGSGTVYTAAANALPSGTIYWRVRAQNEAGDWGPWSNAASFINFGAPDVLSVQTDAKPYATIVWQVDGQEAYRISIDGVIIASDFGDTVRSYTLREPLNDGLHVVAVEAQNEYGQWSEPRETIFEVENVPGTAIALSIEAGLDASLSWTGGGSTGDVYVLRDGVQIGHTGGERFIDRLCLGAHTWTVLEKLPGGYYTKSNTVFGLLKGEAAPMLSKLDGGEWLALTLVKEPNRTQGWSISRQTAMYHVTGADYPVLETGRSRDGSVGDTVAFLDDAEAAAFEDMIGEAVVYKQKKRMIIGALSAAELTTEEESVLYAFTIRRCDYEDFVNEARA